MSTLNTPRNPEGLTKQVILQDPGTVLDVSQWGDSTNNAARVNIVAGSAQGAAAAGDLASGNPLLLGGVDGAGLIQSLNCNQNLTLLASAARTATTNSAMQTNTNGSGVGVFLNITAASGTGGLELFIQGMDPVSGNYRPLNSTPTAITSTGLYYFELYPGAAAGNTNQTTSGVLPEQWRIQVVAGDSSSYTYSVGASVIL